ncbi:MAG: WD40 repeat domain-containing protein [Bacteroidales bacterium]
MQKRTGIILVGLFAVALGVAAYFIRKDKQVVTVDPWIAIPSDAFLIVETPDFPELLTRTTDRTGIMSRLSGMKWASSLIDAAAVIDSVTGGREVREMISNRKVLLSFHVTGQNRASALAVMNTGSSLTARHLIRLCETSGAEVTGSREFGGAKKLTVSYGKGLKKSQIYLALTSGIIIASPLEVIVDNALNNMSAGSDIRHQQGFASVVSASGRETDNLFILFRNLPRFVQSFIAPGEITGVTSAAIAAGGDLTLKEDGLFISGFLSTAGAGLGADRLSDVSPAECGVHELLPQGTLSYKTVMRRASLTGDTAADPASINATDLALALSPFTGNEVTQAMIRAGDSEEKVLLFRMTDRQAAEAVLRDRLTAKYRSMGLKESHFLASVQTDSDEEVVMYKMPFTGVSSILSGEPGAADNEEWVLFARSYMVFSASPAALVSIEKGSENENTLINDPDFREMEKTLPTKSSFLFYSSGSALKSLINKYLTPASSKALTDRTFDAIDGVGLSLTPSNGMIYTSLSVRYRDQDKQRPALPSGKAATDTSGNARVTSSDLNLAWKVKLDAELASVPFLFLNHNTGATEIFVQDQKNNIYLISASGKILWKAAIRERIAGDIFMIDYYKNGKYQLLFTGRDYLHLIDRNGNYVDKFPVRMRSPATNSLAVFDYENNKEYRIFIAGEDRKIYAYDRSGSPVRGWNMFTTRGRVTDPVAFFRVRGKDYLFVSDDQAVYLLDRTGNIRVNPQEPLLKAKGSCVRLTGSEDQALVFTAPDGTLIRLYFDGTVKKQTISTFSTEHSSDFYDFDGDGRTDFLYIDHGMLRVYDNSGSEILSKNFESNNLKGPVLISLSSSDRKTAVYDTDKKLLHLISRNGNSVAGFPRKAGRFYTFGRVANKSTWSLLINENDAYLYNYVLNTGSK